MLNSYNIPLILRRWLSSLGYPVGTSKNCLLPSLAVARKYLAIAHALRLWLYVSPSRCFHAVDCTPCSLWSFAGRAEVRVFGSNFPANSNHFFEGGSLSFRNAQQLFLFAIRNGFSLKSTYMVVFYQLRRECKLVPVVYTLFQLKCVLIGLMYKNDNNNLK